MENPKRFQLFFSKVLWLEPFWILLLTPSILLPGYFWSTTFQPALVLALFLFWPLRLLFQKQFWQHTPIQGQLLFLLLVFPLGIWIAVNRTQAWESAGYILLGMSSYVALINWPVIRRHPELIAILLCSIGVMLAILGPLIVISRPNPLLGEIGQVQPNVEFLGETIHFNVLSGCLVLVLPILLALSLDWRWSRWRWLPPLLGVVAIPIFLVLPLTESRGAYLAIALSLAFVVVIRWPRTLYYLLPLTVIGGFGLAYWADGWLRLFEEMVGTGPLSGLDGRIEVWSRGPHILYDFPLTGIGVGAFPDVTPILYPYFILDDNTPHVHNLFLQVGVDLGIPAMMAYIWLIGKLMGLLWGRIVKVQRCKGAASLLAMDCQLSTIHYPLSIGVLGALIALVIHGLFDAVSWGTKLAFVPWLLMALATLLYQESIAIRE